MCRVNTIKHLRRIRIRRPLLLVLALTIAPVFSGVVYAESYSESSDAFSKLTVYCAKYVRNPHPFTGGSHLIPFTHYVVTFGVNKTSSVDAGATWDVRALNHTWPDYETVGNGKSFLIARSTSLTTLSIYVNWANMTINKGELSVTDKYKISFFVFQRDFVPSESLPART